MSNILLTGMSGTGKTAVIRALAVRGYRAIDTDEEVAMGGAAAGAFAHTRLTFYNLLICRG